MFNNIPFSNYTFYFYNVIIIERGNTNGSKKEGLFRQYQVL